MSLCLKRQFYKLLKLFRARSLSIILTVMFIQMDELWSYLRHKNNPLWVFIGFEVDSRFWVNFE